MRLLHCSFYAMWALFIGRRIHIIGRCIDSAMFYGANVAYGDGHDTRISGWGRASARYCKLTILPYRAGYQGGIVYE